MPKIVCFDFDDVLTEKDTLSRFGELFGHTFKELRLGLELFEDNKEPKKFFKTVKKVIALGKGIKYERVERIADFLKPNRNAKETLSALKRRGFKIAVVSINDKNIISKFLKKQKLNRYVDHIYAGTLGVKNGLLTGEITGDVVETEKVGVVRLLEKKYHVNRDDIYYIGDGMTDLPIMKKIGRGILFCPNAITNAEVLSDRTLVKMQKTGRLCLVEDKDLMRVMDFIVEKAAA